MHSVMKKINSHPSYIKGLHGVIRSFLMNGDPVLHSLKVSGSFRFITYDTNKYANDTGDYGEEYHSEQRVRKRGYEESPGQKYGK